MRTLEAKEVENLQPIIKAAARESLAAPCIKSQRGVVVFRDGIILGRGVNHPPSPRRCIEGVCQAVCRYYTVHAEREACQDALSRGLDLTGASLLHMKRKKGLIVPVTDVGCLDCSSYLGSLYLSGIPLNELILLCADDGKEVFRAYSMEEFYLYSIANLNG